MMVHEDYKELISARALSELSAEDACALEVHIRGCADCRAEMMEWDQTAAYLVLDIDRHEPSPELRGRILDSVREEARARKLAGDMVEGDSASRDGRLDSKVIPFERAHRRERPLVQTFSAIAAALVIGALIISLLILWQQNRATQQELARLSAEKQQAQAQLEQERAAVELLTSPNTRMAKLNGTKDAPGAQAMLAYDKSGHAMLMARGLPAAPAGMAYQLWYIVDSKPMPGKVFTTDGSGNGILEDQLPNEAMGSAVFAITLEPETGVPAPTGKMYLTSS